MLLTHLCRFISYSSVGSFSLVTPDTAALTTREPFGMVVAGISRKASPGGICLSTSPPSLMGRPTVRSLPSRGEEGASIHALPPHSRWAWRPHRLLLGFSSSSAAVPAGFGRTRVAPSGWFLHHTDLPLSLSRRWARGDHRCKHHKERFSQPWVLF